MDYTELTDEQIAERDAIIAEMRKTQAKMDQAIKQMNEYIDKANESRNSFYTAFKELQSLMRKMEY